MAVGVASLGAAAHAALKAQVARINALNVYPVPDGDTGTNMLLTLESTLRDVAEESYASPEEASRAVARAALMGARGNSGVILSQMIRGACDVLARSGQLDAATFAAATDGARERAYASVREPVEGTMLTVIKDAAVAARKAAEEDADLPAVIRAAAQEAHASVRRTPELLPVLRDAGVVDAGGLAVAVILDGFYAAVTGEEIPEPLEDGGAAPDLTAIHAEEEAWGYCTQFVVAGFSGDADDFEDRIHDLGKSVLVIADEDTVNVHLHTQDPGETLSYAGGFGRLARVKIEDMEAQVRERGSERGEREVERASGASPTGAVGVVVASRGAGNRALFERMGAVVVEGGQGANPSAADLAEAARRTGARTVVILPNNKNIVPTAERVGELVEGEVHVVPTLSLAAGLAAMVGFDAEGEPGDVVEEMREIWAALRSAEVTRAVRDARVDGREVPEGSYIGFLDGALVEAGAGVEEVALALAGVVVDEGADLITVLRGEDLDGEAADRIAAGIRDLDGDLEVEVRDGGQPLYPLQMVAE